MDEKRNLCVSEKNEWDVFIAYYGGEANGTQRQAELLYDKLEGTLLPNGHRLKVYQKTRRDPHGPFGQTPEIAKHSRIFLLVADKNIPVDNIGTILDEDSEGSMKRLYEEVCTFNESPNYRDYNKQAVCSVIICDDMTDKAATNLHAIFAGRVCHRLHSLIGDDFLSLRSAISRFLTGEEISSKKTATASVGIFAARGDIKIGEGAKKRLMRTHGGIVPYEQLMRVSDINQALEENPFIEFLPPQEKPFVPDAEMLCDCEKILMYLESTDSLTDEEKVFRQFIRDIKSGTKASRHVARICKHDSIIAYGRFRIQLQPIEYLWIMRMTLLDTPFEDGGKMTTLREKYANPVEEGENFESQPRLACHSGCGVFIITSDGYLVYQNRFEKEDNRVSFFPGKKSYTVSGSYLMNGESVFDFINNKIDRELGSNLCNDVYLWELGYEYDYLHYQFSFFAFCDETLSEFEEFTPQRSAQAKNFAYFDLRDALGVYDGLKIEEWESSAAAVLIGALSSSQFKRLLKEKCGFEFDSRAFIKAFRAGR